MNGATPSASVVPECPRIPPRYQSVQYLGSGASGFVFSANDLEKQRPVAIKFLDKQAVFDKYLQREVLHHRELQHPHVIRFHEVILTQNHIGIVMEFASGGSLRNFVSRMGRLQEPAARWFFQQLIIAVDYCHKRGVMNRDLKLENTLLHWMEGLPLPLLKICDFGYSKADHESAPKSKVGTLAYMAPEVILNRSSYNGKLADVWSCGVMLYEMLFGTFPFHDPSKHGLLNTTARMKNMMERITKMDWCVPDDPCVSQECKDLLQHILAACDSRMSMHQIMSHPWFLVDLAAGAVDMNSQILQQDHSVNAQPVAAIEAVLAEAQMPYSGDLLEYERQLEERLIDDEINDYFHRDGDSAELLS